MAVNDGGPAFARPNTVLPNGDFEYGHEGMALRDYFAAKAMQAEIITSCSDATPEAAQALIDQAAEEGRTPTEQVAHNAYMFADAMLLARRKEMR